MPSELVRNIGHSLEGDFLLLLACHKVSARQTFGKVRSADCSLCGNPRHSLQYEQEVAAWGRISAVSSLTADERSVVYEWPSTPAGCRGASRGVVGM